MSHATISLPAAQQYQNTLVQKDAKLGKFLRGNVEQYCTILSELADDYLVSFFNPSTMTQESAYIAKVDVTVEVEVKEITYWVIKHDRGHYLSAANSSSSAPQLYLTRGKAEGHRKCLRSPEHWTVKKWIIAETDD